MIETLKLKAEEIESLKQKLLPKDAYIQSQSNRIFQLQTTNEKSNQEINAILRNKSVTNLILLLNLAIARIRSRFGHILATTFKPRFMQTKDGIHINQ